MPVLLFSPSFHFYHFFFFYSFAYTMNTHIQRYSFIPMDIPIFLYFKIPFSYFKGTVQFSKWFFRYSSSFHLFKFSKHLILCNSLINYGVISNFSRSFKSQPKFVKQVLNPSNHTNLSPKITNFLKNKHDPKCRYNFFLFHPPRLNEALSSMLKFTQERVYKRKHGN